MDLSWPSARATACILGLTTALLACGPAEAAAVYMSSAHSTFTLVAPPPLSVTDFLPSTSTAATGHATADVLMHVRSPDGTLPATVDSAVGGSAAYAPDSTSTAAAQSGHHFVVPRVDGDGPLPTVEILFSFDFSWDTDLSITRPGLEVASGGAYFAMSGFRDGITELTLDDDFPGALVTASFPDGSNGWEFNPRYFAFDASPVHESHSVTVSGKIKVYSGMVGAFSVITDTAGSAVSVPEPSSAWLLLAAWPAAALACRRRRAGASRPRGG